MRINDYDFGCLIAGNYAAMVPGHSYAGAVGFPLPVEFTFRNLSLDIAFQGGDINHAVGAFSIQPGKSTTAAGTKEICFPLPPCKSNAFYPEIRKRTKK